MYVACIHVCSMYTCNCQWVMHTWRQRYRNSDKYNSEFIKHICRFCGHNRDLILSPTSIISDAASVAFRLVAGEKQDVRKRSFLFDYDTARPWSNETVMEVEGQSTSASTVIDSSLKFLSLQQANQFVCNFTTASNSIVWYRWNISSVFSRTSEANASEFLENHDEMFLRCSW